MLCVNLWRSMGLKGLGFEELSQPKEEVYSVSTFSDLMMELMVALAVESLSLVRPKVQLGKLKRGDCFSMRYGKILQVYELCLQE